MSRPSPRVYARSPRGDSVTSPPLDAPLAVTPIAPARSRVWWLSSQDKQGGNVGSASKATHGPADATELKARRTIPRQRTRARRATVVPEARQGRTEHEPSLLW